MVGGLSRKIKFEDTANETSEVSNLSLGANVLTWTLSKGKCSALIHS